MVGQVMMIDDFAQIERAQSVARRAHLGQFDKSGTPYLEHCQRVAAKLKEPSAVTVAWLHDVLEDSDVSEAELRDQFESAVVDAVVAITRVPGEAAEAYYDRVRANELARQVKLADIHDNLNPLRLARLEPATAERLIKKYAAALSALFP